MGNPGKKPNRLIKEKSPYLLQHAYNPVDWYPWGEEAFEKAKRDDKLIFLSSGYSTCHWCHVMEEESYNDKEVAGLMNEAFVSIKIDREERPDIDNVYIAVSEMLTGTAGWPLNVIMTPDKKPFFAATYIPKDSRFGMVGMVDLIREINEFWRTKRGELLKSAGKVASVLAKAGKVSPGVRLGGETGASLGIAAINAAYREMSGNFDAEYGGFGIAPKFPAPHALSFLLRYHKKTGSGQAKKMAETTLASMRLGGVYDHVGFGFHRYSTDREWIVPHFEKMLYDQALASIAYTEAYQLTRKKFYEKTAREIIAYVLRDMTSPSGGFYSAEDADSEGREGKFYLWKEEEIRRILGKDEADFASNMFNIKRGGNLPEEAGREGQGENILYLRKTPPGELSGELSKGLGPGQEEVETMIESIRRKLFSCREARVHPYKDDKILTDWNGLMIAALSKAGAVFEEKTYIDAAKKAADFILKNLFAEKDKGLFHCYREGSAAVPGNLNDYAFFIWGLLELYEAAFEEDYLGRALGLNSIMMEKFWDNENGGFYFTEKDAEKLFFRQKESHDGALPSGNSAALLNLLRLFSITGDSCFQKRADSISRAFSGNINRSPFSHAYFLSALLFAIGPSYHVVITGDSKKEDTKNMLKMLQKEFIPNKTVVFKPEDNCRDLTGILPQVKTFKTIKGKATAYVCVKGSCKEPLTDGESLLSILEEKK